MESSAVSAKSQMTKSELERLEVRAADLKKQHYRKLEEVQRSREKFQKILHESRTQTPQKTALEEKPPVISAGKRNAIPSALSPALQIVWKQELLKHAQQSKLLRKEEQHIAYSLSVNIKQLVIVKEKEKSIERIIKQGEAAEQALKSSIEEELLAEQCVSQRFALEQSERTDTQYFTITSNQFSEITQQLQPLLRGCDREMRMQLACIAPDIQRAQIEKHPEGTALSLVVKTAQGQSVEMMFLHKQDSGISLTVTPQELSEKSARRGVVTQRLSAADLRKVLEAEGIPVDSVVSHV